jgi:poly(hydroxyalkanoate) depolymerase family esterase
MNSDFVAEILRATGSLRAGDQAGVSAIIQSALAAAGLTDAGADAAHGREQLPRRSQRLRKPLGEVIRTLTAGKEGLGLDGTVTGLGRPAPAPEQPLPTGASFLDRSYSCAAGARRYRLYVPASAGEGLQALVVMLHGCTQTPEDFAAGTGMNALAEEHRLLVAYPAQTGGENPMSCWNWFRPGDQLRGSGEPAIIAGLTESLRAEYGVPEGRVFVAGLSAGGAMAAIMAQTYPELYEAVGVHSGLAFGSANDVMSAFTAMRGQVAIERAFQGGGGDAPRMIVFHGTADTTVHPSNAERIVAGAAEGAVVLRSVQGPAGITRGYTRKVTTREDGMSQVECWMIEGAPHAWSGGHPSGTYTDPRGPDASAAMVRFFLEGAADEQGAVSRPIPARRCPEAPAAP